jgi:hypothetical protein
MSFTRQVKVSLCWIKHHVMKWCGREWSILAPGQDGDQWSATRCGRITFGENATGIRELTSWVGNTGIIKNLGNKTNALPLSSPATSHTCFAVLMNTWKTAVHHVSYILDRHRLSCPQIGYFTDWILHVLLVPWTLANLQLKTEVFWDVYAGLNGRYLLAFRKHAVPSKPGSNGLGFLVFLHDFAMNVKALCSFNNIPSPPQKKGGLTFYEQDRQNFKSLNFSATSCRFNLSKVIFVWGFEFYSYN